MIVIAEPSDLENIAKRNKVVDGPILAWRVQQPPDWLSIATQVRFKIDEFFKGSTKMADPLPDLPPANAYDPVIEAYKKDIDRTLLRENLKLTPAQRATRFSQVMKMIFELRRAARKRRGLDS